MLVLSRKIEESIMVGGSAGFESMLKVTVLEISSGNVRLGFEVDKTVPVHRAEVWERIKLGGRSLAWPTAPCAAKPAALGSRMSLSTMSNTWTKGTPQAKMHHRNTERTCQREFLGSVMRPVRLEATRSSGGCFARSPDRPHRLIGRGHGAEPTGAVVEAVRGFALRVTLGLLPVFA